MPHRILPRRPLETDVWTLACERTAYTFEHFDHVLVAFSGGKDSTAVLNVALEVARSDRRFERHLPLRVVFYDEEAIPYETEAYARRVAGRDDVTLEWYCLPVRHRNACTRLHPWWWPWAPEDEDKWCRPMPAGALTQLNGFPIEPAGARLSIPDANGLLFPPERGNGALLMGIRAAESINRQRAVSWRKHDNFLVHFNEGTSAGNVWKSYPVYDWSTKDVWTAPALKGWDYNRAYDRLEMAGVPIHQQRCSPAFGEEPLQKLHLFASCFPDLWEKMTSRVPGAGSAARYAKTELYAFRDRPEKPPGMRWPEFVLHYVGKHRDTEARKIAKRIRWELGFHYRKTSLPIVENARNPVSGLRWSFLLALAMRGDFKSRRHASTGMDNDDQKRGLARYWRSYAAELEQIIAEGRYGELAAPVPAPADPWALIPDDVQESR